MKIDDLQNIIDRTQWDYLDHGSYNHVSVSRTNITIEGYTGRWVRKKIIDQDELMSNSTRAIRKWNLHNPDYPAFQTKEGWLLPYLGNVPASDEQIAEKLVEIYQNTGNVIADACGRNNFLFYQNKVICIDMDLSLRRGSFASEDYLSNNYVNSDNARTYWDACAAPEKKPKTVAVIETLCYLEQHLPNYNKKNLITPRLIQLLHIFRLKKIPVTMEIMDILLEIVNIDHNSEIKNKLITPQLINTLQNIKQHSLITKDLLVNLAQDQLWDPTFWADDIDENELLEVVQSIIQRDTALINKTGPRGYTLLHISAMYSHCELARYVINEGSDLNTVSQIAEGEFANIQHSGKTAIEIATQSGSYVAYILADKGARVPPEISTYLPKYDTKIENGTKKPEIEDSFRMTRFYGDLLHFSTNTSTLSEERQIEFLSIIFQHPYFLTCELHDNGSNFVHLAFASNHVRVINELVKHPQWEVVSQTKNQKNGWTLWHYTVINGHIENCLHLKSIDVHAVTKRSHSSALHIAATVGKHEFCKKLLEQGANPVLKSKTQMAACPLLAAVMSTVSPLCIASGFA